MVWDGGLLWAVEEQGVRAVIDPQLGWQVTFAPGWFVPAVDPWFGVPTTIPLPPTPFVGRDRIVLSRPDGYWKGEIGVFSRGDPAD